MEGKEIFGVLINLIVWPLIIYWLFKSRSENIQSKKNLEEYNKPENKFERELKRLGLDLSHFSSRGFYPYIMKPFYDNWQNAAIPNFMEGGFDIYTFKTTKDITKGASETLLYQSLVKRFGASKVFKENHSLYGYFPDILYVDKNAKTFIDIEIDEPYSFKTKEPIHFCNIEIDENGKKSLDDPNLERDKSFRKYGWTVIRFSEEQVRKSTDACCDIVEYVTTYFALTPPTKSLASIEIDRVKRWTKEEAKAMALAKSREI